MLDEIKLKNFYDDCVKFCGNVIQFVQRLHWGTFTTLLETFLEKLKAKGAAPHLIPILEITFVTEANAAILYKEGYTTPGAIANAEAPELQKILKRTCRPGEMNVSVKTVLCRNQQMAASGGETSQCRHRDGNQSWAYRSR